MGKRAFIAGNVLGLFAFDEEGRLLAHERFHADAKAIVTKLASMASTEEGRSIVSRLSDYECVFEAPGEPSQGGEFLRSGLDNLLKEIGVSKAEYEGLLRSVTLEKSKAEITRAFGQADNLIIQAAAALEDLDEAINNLAERLREWHSLHFPELDAKIAAHEEFTRLIERYGSRESLASEPRLSDIAKSSLGAEMDEKDIRIMQGFAHGIVELCKARSSAESYLTSKMESIASNLSAVAGPVVGAKLISLAGGLKELADMPASRIQVLGAEKALFRHLREGGMPPKHGALYQHPSVSGSPWWIRGRISRSLAGKIAIAARADAYSARFIAEPLKASLEKKIGELKKVPEPPRKMRPLPKERKSGRGR